MEVFGAKSRIISATAKREKNVGKVGLHRQPEKLSGAFS